MIDAELKLWQALRYQQIASIRFRRQAPIGEYIVDFVSYDIHLIIEVDGGQHNDIDQIKYDSMRTQWLESQGYTVLRFWNHDVLLNLDVVLEKIWDICKLKTPHPILPPRFAEGRDPSDYFDLGGTIRSCSVDETLRFLAPLMESLGITRVANITGLDNIGIPVAIAIRPNAKHLSVTMGKGMTWELAKASAMMESVEVYHAENPPLVGVNGSYNKLINNLSIVSPCEFNPGFFNIPHLENIVLDWVNATDLMSQQTVLIPHILTNLDSTGVRPEYGLLQVSSNGLAAGNTLEEALCHSLYEVIERDSLSHWGCLPDTERNLTKIDLEMIDSPLNQRLIEKYSYVGIQLKIWDITSALGIPSFHCVMYDPNPFRVQGIFRGTGTHLSKHIALARTLMEAAQSRLGVISGARDDIFPDQYQQQLEFVDNLQGQNSFSIKNQNQLSHSFAEDIKIILNLLSQSGFHKVYMVNHTKSDIKIPVVQVLIPGMRFNSARI